MTNLIPEKRMNKNGVLVTKHVKASQETASDKSLPAPSMTPPAGSTKHFKPSPRQRQKEYQTALLNYTEADAELTDRLAKNGDHYGKTIKVGYRFTASEVDFYDIHSIASLGDTLTMMTGGIKTKEEAIAFLEEKHLTRCLKENPLAGHLLENRVSFDAYLQFHENTPFDEQKHDPKLYAEAALIFTVPRYRSAVTEDGGAPHEWVLDGKVNAYDLMQIGSSRLTKVFTASPVLRALERINSGEADYDAEQLGPFLDHVNSLGVGYTIGVNLINSYGIEFTKNISDLWKMKEVHMTLIDQDSESRRKAISYVDEITQLLPNNTITMDGMLALHAAGIDPKVAADRSKAGLRVNQIIAVDKEGIASSVSSGYL